jgi:hypothetical protein
MFVAGRFLSRSAPNLTPSPFPLALTPSVYHVGLNYLDLNARKMFLWIATSVAHSLIVFWIPYGLYSPIDGSEYGARGWTDGMDVAGLMTFCSLVWGMQVKVALETKTWTWVNHLVLAVGAHVLSPAPLRSSRKGYRHHPPTHPSAALDARLLSLHRDLLALHADDLAVVLHGRPGDLLPGHVLAHAPSRHRHDVCC